MRWINQCMCLILFIACHIHGAAIIGIDFGSKYIKIASVQPGKPFDIVLNENSKRKSEQCIAYGPETRYYSSTAYAYSSRSPESVVLRSRDLLGCGLECDRLQTLKKFNIIYDVVEEPESKSLKIVINKGTDIEAIFNAEAIVAMILGYVKRMAEIYTEDVVIDCVITVPPFFSQTQREALLTAADIAGLKVITLVDETVAAAVQHGVYNEFTDEVRNILIYNMGASSTKVGIFAFSGKLGAAKKVNTRVVSIGKGWDANLGGDDFDAVLVNFFVDKFDNLNEKHISSSIRTNAKAMARVEKEANRVKTVLSANIEIPVSIENLHEGRDLKIHVTRKEFMELSNDLLKRITAPIDIALKESQLSLTDIHQVELVGGGVRIPRIKEILKEYFGSVDLGSHLNGDEAMVFGSVFVAANMSTAFRVRPVYLADRTHSAVQLQLESPGDSESEPWVKSTELYSMGYALDSKKIVSFNRDKGDISCSLLRSDEHVVDYQISGLDKFVSEFGKFGSPKVSLTFVLSLNDTVALVKADVSVVEQIETEADKAEETSASTENDESEEKSENASTEEASTTEDSKPKSKKPKQKTHVRALTITRTDAKVPVKSLSDESIAACKESLRKMDEHEDAMRAREAAKNGLESFIFSSRHLLRSDEESVDRVFASDAKDELFEDLMAMEDWLDEDGKDAKIEDFAKRREEMQKRIDSVLERVSELDQRPAAISAARKLIKSIRKQISGYWAKERPWVTEEETGRVLATVESFEKWLADAEKAQDASGLQGELVLRSADVSSHLEPVQWIIEEVLKRPMPRPKKSETKKADGASGESASDEEEPVGEDSETVEEETVETNDSGESNDSEDTCEGEDCSDEKDEL